MLFSTSVQHPLGLNPGMNERIRVIVRGGTDLKQGTIGQFLVDDADDGAVADTLNYGQTDSPMSNIFASVAAENLSSQAFYSFLCVLDEDIDDDAQGWVVIRGDVALAWDAADSNSRAKGGTAGETAGLISLMDGDHERVVAIAREDSILYVAGDASTLTQCYFDGINSFGQFSA